MNPYYRDYEWKEGVPRGIGILTPEEAVLLAVGYKIVSDPYRKRISVERYKNAIFETIIYDSQQLDFRSLRQEGRATSWQRETIFEKADQVRALIRDQDDRVVLIETQYFENGYCRECQLHSPMGILLSIHKLSYTGFGDSFNGVVLYDSQQRPVMTKKYDIDQPTGQFTLVLSEQW